MNIVRIYISILFIIIILVRQTHLKDSNTNNDQYFKMKVIKVC